MLELLELEEVGTDLYRTVWLRDEPYPLYGGQVAAQALQAAGRTVPSERVPHSLHGYFLRPGNSSAHVVFRVDRDLNGRSYSGRRVVALQAGKPIFTMSASFTQTPDKAEREADAPPAVPQPEALHAVQLPRVISLEARQVPRDESIATRFWARCTDPLVDDGLLQTCVLTYLSDTSSRKYLGRGNRETRWGPSIDHAIWFHGPVDLNAWVLTSKSLKGAAAGRGCFTGGLYDAAGRLLATVRQEGLIRHLPETPSTSGDAATKATGRLELEPSGADNHTKRWRVSAQIRNRQED